MFTSLAAMIYLSVLTIEDSKKRELSTGFLLGGTVPAVMAMLHGIFVNGGTWEEVLFGMLPGLVLVCLACLGKGAGVGDGIVLMQLNLFLFLEKTVMAFTASLLAIAVFSGLLLLLKKGDRELRIPYLPFLWLGTFLALVV